MSTSPECESPRGMTGLVPGMSTAENYRRFARQEAAGRSPEYAALAEAVADDALVLGFLNALPPDKRQPNLLFAAARYLLNSPPTLDLLHTFVMQMPSVLTDVMTSRRTQTNEAGRCAVLLPALAQIPGPLALLEVGASAGLTLLPDKYSYDYAGHEIRGNDSLAPVLSCEPRGPVPLPAEVPSVVWRTGIDVNPLDINNTNDLEWLSCLIWPGDEERSQRLHAAAETARREPSTVHRGDLLDDLERVASEAPDDTTLVIYHSAVLAYVDEETREKFATAVTDLGAVWLSNEAPGVLPGTDIDSSNGFVLVRDGSEVLARTDPHGAWIEWLARDC